MIHFFAYNDLHQTYFLLSQNYVAVIRESIIKAWLKLIIQYVLY